MAGCADWILPTWLAMPLWRRSAVLPDQSPHMAFARSRIAFALA
jgi:hypothetical protein